MVCWVRLTTRAPGPEFVVEECGDLGAEVGAEEFFEAASEGGDAPSEADGPLAAEGGAEVEGLEEFGGGDDQDGGVGDGVGVEEGWAAGEGGLVADDVAWSEQEEGDAPAVGSAALADQAPAHDVDAVEGCSFPEQACARLEGLLGAALRHFVQLCRSQGHGLPPSPWGAPTPRSKSTSNYR